MQMEMWSSVQSLLAVVGGGVVVIGAIVAAAYGLFKIFSEKWLEAKFAERRETLRHEQQKEIEALRNEFARLSDRATKLNQREFDVIPEAWARLCEAFSGAASLMKTIQDHPDIDNMTPEHQEEFITGCKLAEWEKSELKKAEMKTDYYWKRVCLHRLWKAQEYARDLTIYVRKNGIVMPKKIREKFLLFDEIIWEALVEQEHYHSNYINLNWQARDKFFSDGPALMEKLEESIEKRLSDLTNAANLP